MAGRIAPDLGRQRIMRQQAGQAGIFVRESNRSRAGLSAAGLAIVVVFAGQRDEPAITNLETKVARQLIALAITLVVKLTITRADFDPGIAAQFVVEHAGNRVRTILCSGAIAQHLQVLDRDRGDCRNIGALRAKRQAGITAGVNLHQRRAVEPLAVEHDQHLIGRQPAQRRRAHESRSVRDRVLAYEERWHHVLDLIKHVGGRLALQFGSTDHVNRRGRVRYRAVRTAGADHDNRVISGAGCRIFGRAAVLRERRIAEEYRESGCGCCKRNLPAAAACGHLHLCLRLFISLPAAPELAL